MLLDEFQVLADVNRQERQAKTDADLHRLLRECRCGHESKRKERGEASRF